MLGTFSFEPYFKSYLCFTVWSLEISEFVFGSFSPSSSNFALFLPPLCRAPPARHGELPPRATSCLLAHASLRSFPAALCHCAMPLLALPRAPAEPRAARAAATLPPRWRARCRGRRLLLARAQALQKPQQAIPRTLSPAPCSPATERRRRSTPNAGEPRSPSTRLTAASPPALTPPLALPCLREASRPLLLAQSSPERRLRRSPLPLIRLLCRAAASEPLPAPQDHP